MTAKKFAPITAEQEEALRDFANYQGAAWKDALLAAWRVGGSRWDGPYYLLHRLRNTHGPSWLKAYKLKG